MPHLAEYAGLFAAAFLAPVRAQFPMGGVQEPRAVVKQFDRDANGRLNRPQGLVITDAQTSAATP